MKKLSIGFSPCPNDTFMFDALVNGKIHTGEISFEIRMADVEQLNQQARSGIPDITKTSFGNYPAISENYALLNAGSALGNGCGPLVISKLDFSLSDLNSLTVAIPGRFTTANLLLSIFFPGITKKPEMIFSSIEQAVLGGKADAGLVIHESRFTYSSRGLRKIADLGEIWEKTTGTPVPLGGIAMKRSLGQGMQQTVSQLIKQSIGTAFENPDATMDYVKKHAQEMEESVIRQHVNLYVNNFSLDLGTEGKKSIRLLLKKGAEFGLIPAVNLNPFAETGDVNYS